MFRSSNFDPLTKLKIAFRGYKGELGVGGGHINDNGDLSAEGDAVNHPRMDATSKVYRYDDGPADQVQSAETNPWGQPM